MTDQPSSTSPRLWRGLGLGAAALGLAAGPAAALSPSAPQAPATQPLVWHVQAESGEAGEDGEAAVEAGEQGEAATEAGEQGESGAAPAAEAGEAGEAGAAPDAAEAGEAGESAGAPAAEGGEAGEAGEAGLATSDDPDATYAARLVFLDAHLRSALAAERAGLPEEAEDLVGEAEDILEELEPEIATRGATGLTEDGIEALEDALEDGGDAQAAFDALSASVFEALAPLPPRARFDALLALTRGAASEHARASENPKYLVEAQAYLGTARALADLLAQDGDASVADAGTEAAQALAEAETQLAADSADTTILPAAAARVELAGLQVR
jgi:hypothetical protein